jgi:hypothetical protein
VSPHQIIAVGVRLFAIWLVLDVVPGAVWSYGQLADPNNPSKLLFAIAVTVTALVVAIALWLFPQSVARKLLTTSPSGSVPSATPDTWLAMGCGLIGLLTLTRYVPTAIRDIVVLLASRDTLEDTTPVRHWLIFNAAEIAIGIWLVFGAKGFRKLFWWARTAGVGESSNNRSRGP